MYLFGFGSLINLISAQKSFKRVLTQNDLIPVKIKGYERVWNALESIQFKEKQVNGVFLNIQKKEDSILNGVVIEISKEELEILKLREKNYSCITIKSNDVLDKSFDDNLIACNFRFFNTMQQPIFLEFGIGGNNLIENNKGSWDFGILEIEKQERTFQLRHL